MFKKFIWIQSPNLSGTNGKNEVNGTNEIKGQNFLNELNKTNESNGIFENNITNDTNETNESIITNESNKNINSKDKKDSNFSVQNQSSTDEIIKIEKVIVPLPYRGLFLTGQAIGCLIPIIGHAALPLMQPLEHHGLIIEAKNGYYYTHYGSRINVSLKFNKNKEICINEIIDGCSNCNRKYSCHEIKIPDNSSISINKIKNIINELTKRFNPDNYHGINNNCQLYIKALLMKLFYRKDLPKNIYGAMVSSFLFRTS